jgi:hypothetical protein
MSLIPGYDVRYMVKNNRYVFTTMQALADVSHLEVGALCQLSVYASQAPIAYIVYYFNHYKKEIYVDLVVNTAPGTGLGAKLLNVIITLAARFHYSVRLVAAPHYPVEGVPDRPAITLYRYYARLGFTPAVDFEAPGFNAAFVEFTT